MAARTPDTRPMETTDAAHQPRSTADVDGVPTNLQHGLLDAGQGTRTPAEPVDGDWARRAAAGAADAWADADEEEDKRAKPGARPPTHIDNPLESLGKAITEPVRDASDEADRNDRPAGDRAPGPRVS